MAADMHLDQLIAAADLLERLGDERGQPFGEPRPDRPRPALRTVAAEADIRPPLRPAPDEGAEVDAGDVDALRGEFARLDDRLRHDVARWAMEAGRAGRTWTMQKKGPVSRRRWEVSRAALALAALADGDDAIARAALALVLGEDDCQTHPIGALLGTLTIEEADRVAAIAQTCTLTLSDDGSPLVAVAS
jgi:hypothetical protein